MKNCKRILFVGAFCLFSIALTHTAHAAARSNAGIDYLFRNPSLGRLTAGVYAGESRREVSQAGVLMDTTLTSGQFYGYLGIDIMSWLNVYGILGMNESKLANTPTADAEILYGMGISFNLLNHFIREPTPMEDAFRINGDIRIVSTEANLLMGGISWQELSASLRFSLVNFPVGDKNYRPEAIALYAGPAFSHIRSSNISATQNFGAIGGLEIFFFDTFSLDLNVEYYDTTSIFGGLNVRF